MHSNPLHCIVPPYITERLTRSKNPGIRSRAMAHLSTAATMRAFRQAAQAMPTLMAVRSPNGARTRMIHDSAQTEVPPRRSPSASMTRPCRVPPRQGTPATLLVLGLGVLVAADGVLAVAASPGMTFLGVSFWGLHMALTQGLLSKLVADTAPTELRGTAFGNFNLVSGGALLLASVIAGMMWSAWGAPATFVAGAAFAALEAAGLLLYRPQARPAANGAAA